MSKQIELYNDLYNIGIAERLLEDLQLQVDTMIHGLSVADANAATEIAGFQYTKRAFEAYIAAIKSGPEKYKQLNQQRKKKDDRHRNESFLPDKEEL